MNSSSKVPPRFVPTLTEVVESEASAPEEAVGSAHPADQAGGRAQQVLGPQKLGDSVLPSARPSFHTPWLADGLYGRGRPAGIPHQLPPLPESLPPQQSFAQSMTPEPVQAAWAGQVEHGPAIASPVEALQPVPPTLPDAAPLEDERIQPVVEAEASCEKATGPIMLAPVAELAGESVPVPSAVGPQETLDVHEAVVTEEYLVHRLMQRVDLVLEQRLREAIAQVVEAQTRSLVLRLREEVETVVRQSVYEAVEAELAQQTRRPPIADSR